MIFKNHILTTLILLFCSFNALAAGDYFLSGMVRDSVSLEPLPFAAVTLGSGGAGSLTDEKGIFGITVPDNASSLQVSCLGYAKKTVAIRKRSTNLYDILLVPEAQELKEVVVKKQKYSKKNNPAVDFVKRLKEKGTLTDPRRLDRFSYTSDQHITLAINDFAKRDESSALFKRFPFLWEYVDTSEISGKPILNIASHDKALRVTYDHGSRSEEVIEQKSVGIDEVADVAGMQTFYEDALREINLYDNDINILQNRFVSPLSRIAPDFYRFYLTDTVPVDSEQCIVLSFYPRNSAAFGFIGQVFVPLDNPDMPIRRVSMRTSNDINLNFIESLHIHQKFATAPDGSSLKLSDDITIEARLMPGTPGIYCRRHADYDNFVLDTPDISDEEVVTYENTDSVVPGAHDSVAELLTRLRRVPLYYWTEKTLSILVKGYVPTAKLSKFDVGPVNTAISHNSFEGWRFRVGGMTTANLSPRIFSRGYLAYGLRDRRFKYKAELEYSFIDKNYHSREFPVQSLRLTHMYDVDHIGQHYLFTNSDNFFLSLKRREDLQVAYQRLSSLEYTLELRNNFSVHATVAHRRLMPTADLPFVRTDGYSFRHLNSSAITLELRYAPGEKFYQTKTYRIPVNLDAPVFLVSHTFAPSGALGNTFPLNKTEISVQKRFWFSAFGYTDIIARGGHIWSSSPFPDLLIPNANLSYTIQPESFALMNPMEFITDTYGSLFFTYWANGAILNYIPGVKKLRLREVFGVNTFIGSLSRRNNPAYHQELLCMPFPGRINPYPVPYVEASVGLDNIFRCLRIDYVWRLTHLHPTYPIDRRGLRIAFHMTF